jgi:hypothetical protein
MESEMGALSPRFIPSTRVDQLFLTYSLRVEDYCKAEYIFLYFLKGDFLDFNLLCSTLLISAPHIPF